MTTADQSKDIESNAYTQAMAALKAQQYQTALQGFNQLLRAEPTYAPAFLGRAIAQFHLGLARAAVTDAQRAAQLQPDLASAQEVIAKAQAQLGNVAQAIAAYKQATRQYLAATPPDKTRAQACIAKAEQLQTASDRPKAQATVDPTLSAETYLERAIHHIDRGDPAAALIDLNWLMQFEPDNLEALWRRAQVCAQLNQKELAVRDMARLKELDPDSRETQLRRACLRIDLGDAAGAIPELTALMQPEKPNSDIFLQRARAQQQLGNWEDAFKDYSNGIGAGSEEPALYEGRGEVRWQTRDLEGAIEDYTQAATLWLNKGQGDRYTQLLERVKQLQDALKQQQQEEEAEKQRLIRVPILYRVNGIVVVQATLNDRYRSEMAIATSSAYSVIPRALAEQLDYEPLGMAWYRTLDGETARAELGIVDKIQVGTAIARSVRVVIAEWDSPACLGQSFFGEYDINIRGDEVEFYRR